MLLRATNDAEYRWYKQYLKTHVVACHYDGCTSRATSPDHRPRLMEHNHVRGSGCCRLLPACAPCNTSDGATHGNRNREPHTPW
jgi:hypothetical protein